MQQPIDFLQTEALNPDRVLKMDAGWVEGIRHCASPNFGSRPPGSEVSLLVVHNISLPPDQFGGDYIERFFLNDLPWDAHPYFETIRNVQVSSHFLIKRTGQVIQFVSCLDRAWHAGRSEFQGAPECNDYSVGIELEGADHTPYETLQYRSLTGLTRTLMAAFPAITPERITGHSDIAPGRKTDPGPAFEWQGYLGSL